MTTSLIDLSQSRLFFGGYWLLLFLLTAVEMVWPIHRGPREPQGRLIANFGMGVLNTAMLTLAPVSLVAIAQWAQSRGFGLINLAELNWAAAAIATIIVRSLSGYLIHRMLHANKLLWRVHRVHHCDVAVDLSTGFRNHPLETIFVVASLSALILILGLAPLPLALYEIAAAAFAIWSHANLRLPSAVERTLRLLLVTPELHHVHHSAERHQTDSNYGEVLSIWDRLFGTYHRLDRAELRALRLGLGDTHDAHAASIVRQLRAPLQHEGSDRAGDPR